MTRNPRRSRCGAAAGARCAGSGRPGVLSIAAPSHADPAEHGYTIEENVAAGVRVYLDCLKRGIPAFSPHLGGAFPSAWSEVPWETWLDYDLRVIDRCTHVLMLPRWETSDGAVKERAYAEQIGRPVLMSVDDLQAACEAQGPQ